MFWELRFSTYWFDTITFNKNQEKYEFELKEYKILE